MSISTPLPNLEHQYDKSGLAPHEHRFAIKKPGDIFGTTCMQCDRDEKQRVKY